MPRVIGLIRDFHLFKGHLAQLVEQRTENPCVLGSIPRMATCLIKHPIFLCRDSVEVTNMLLLNYVFIPEVRLHGIRISCNQTH
jgi:hypothetical protein